MPLWFWLCRVQRLTFVWSKYLYVCHSLLSPFLLLNFRSVQLLHFSLNFWKSPPAQAVGRVTSMQSSRVVPALGSLMLMLVHGKPPSEVTRHDGCDSHIKHKAAREKGVPKQNSARLSVSLMVPSPWRRPPWDNMELNCQVTAGSAQLSCLWEINSV